MVLNASTLKYEGDEHTNNYAGVRSQQLVEKVCHHSHCRNALRGIFGIACLSGSALCGAVLEAPVVEALLNARASVEIRNKEGLLPADIALPATWITWAGAEHMRVTAGLVKYVRLVRLKHVDPTLPRTPFALHPVLGLVTRRLVHLYHTRTTRTGTGEITTVDARGRGNHPFCSFAKHRSERASSCIRCCPRKKSQERSHPEILLKNYIRTHSNLLGEFPASH